MEALSYIFWTSLAALAFTYLGYPLLLYLRMRLWPPPRPSQQGQGQVPSLLLAIPACDEEAVIAAKIEDARACDYPADRFRLVVVTDGSLDATPDIVAGYAGVGHLHGTERKGKAAAMNRAVAAAEEADIIVFSDANTRLSPMALRELAAPFLDPAVCAVAGEKCVITRGEGAHSGESLYWRYESLMKRLEDGTGTVIGAAGELFAIRREHYSPIPEDIVLDDLYVSLRLLAQGCRIAYARGARAMEPSSASLSDEWERKVRIAAGAFQLLPLFGGLLNPLRHGAVSFRFLFRRVARWVVCPAALAAALIANVILAGGHPSSSRLYAGLLACQGFFYMAALAGLLSTSGMLPRWRFPGTAFHFVMLHAAVFAGWVRHLRGGQTVAWRKATRVPT